MLLSHSNSLETTACTQPQPPCSFVPLDDVIEAQLGLQGPLQVLKATPLQQLHQALVVH